MLKQVLFDLDGTLLHFDHHLFVKNYVALLCRKFAHLMAPAEFSKHLLTATARMLQNNSHEQTNESVFWSYFETHTNLRQAALEPLLDAFYEQDFHQLKKIVTVPDMRPVVEKIVAKGLPIVLATNPVFPQKAIQARLSWAGLETIPFSRITTYENSHFCKPNPAYYREISSITGIAPEECLMIGNDVSEDMAAGKIGMKTYLLTDFLLGQNTEDIRADYRGTIQDLYRQIDEILA